MSIYTSQNIFDDLLFLMWVYDAVSVSKLLISAIAEFDLSHG